MGLFDFWARTRPTDNRKELCTRLDNATKIMMDAIQAAREVGYNVEMNLKDGTLSLLVKEVIFETKINEKPTQNAKKQSNETRKK